MACSGIMWRLLDGVFLITVFIIQSIILSLFTVYSKSNAELPSDYVNPYYQKLLWLVGDLICLLGFAMAWLFGSKQMRDARALKQTELDTIGEDTKSQQNVKVQPSKYSFIGYITSEKLPLTYISWFFYATLLTLKITVICSDWMEKYGGHEKEGDDGDAIESLEPEMLLLGIGLSGIIFSLLVEANHNAGDGDMKRNAYLNQISYGVALEILDTASLLSFLLPSSETLSRTKAAGLPINPCPTIMTAAIIALSAINLILPCITLYKLTANKFGEIYHVKVELIYNSLHFLLVSVPFVVIRVYLWAIHGHKDILFLIKNMYMIVGYFRGTFTDLVHLKRNSGNQVAPITNGSTNAKNRRDKESGPNPNGDNSIEMKSLMK